MELAKRTSVWLHDHQGKAWNDDSDNIECRGRPKIGIGIVTSQLLLCLLSVSLHI
jgi:hypothetical protein